MAVVTGVITVAQENRFQLAVDGGGTRLFVLSHRAPIDPDQLAALRNAQARVAVTFRPIEGLIAEEARGLAEISAETSIENRDPR